MADDSMQASSSLVSSKCFRIILEDAKDRILNRQINYCTTGPVPCAHVHCTLEKSIHGAKSKFIAHNINSAHIDMTECHKIAINSQLMVIHVTTSKYRQDIILY